MAKKQSEGALPPLPKKVTRLTEVLFLGEAAWRGGRMRLFLAAGNEHPMISSDYDAEMSLTQVRVNEKSHSIRARYMILPCYISIYTT